MVWKRRKRREDREVLVQIEPLLTDLWRPMRFLADMKEIWPNLSDQERREIEDSRPYREGFHEKWAEYRVAELLALAHQLNSNECRPLRRDLVAYLETWPEQEPDKLKIFAAVVKSQADG